ncbi:hypothetical protein [Kitasatospora sp. NPDC004289]
MSTVLPEDLDRRLAAELVPQCPAPPRPRRTAAPTASPAADPLASEHRAQLLAALRRPATRTAPSPRETAA